MTPIQLLSKVIRDLLLSTTSAEPLERHHQSDWPPRDVIFAHSQFLLPLSFLRSLQESSITLDILFMHVINSSCLLSLASFETDKCRLTELRWCARVSAALGIGHRCEKKASFTIWSIAKVPRIGSREAWEDLIKNWSSDKWYTIYINLQHGRFKCDDHSQITTLSSHSSSHSSLQLAPHHHLSHLSLCVINPQGSQFRPWHHQWHQDQWCRRRKAQLGF